MCMSCGCQEYSDDHGDERNITMEDLEQAAEAAGIDVQSVVRNIQEAFNGERFAEGTKNSR